MDAAAKQQIVERLKQANSILVTVSNNPSVDQLAACIGATLLLNRIQKHATAVFSGNVPSTLEFLQPEKTIERTTDSLRDFIISLDKSKADKLRYKVEDQVVRIFITPYRTKISEADLVFSEGDFNVEAVLALGVQDRNQIDAAITAHGRILHDATVITVNTGHTPPTTMGQLNWQDANASSLSEMIVSISEAFGTGLIDNQMATAFLTGIVSETDRFSNDRTSPRVMTMSAQLMAAGANQQLIAAKLDETAPVKVPQATSAKKAAVPADSGVLSIPHEAKKAAAPPPPSPAPAPSQIQIDEKGDLVPEAPKPPVPPAPELPKIQLSDKPMVGPPPVPAAGPSLAPPPTSPHAYLDPNQYQPVMSSSFSATTGGDAGSGDAEISSARSAVDKAIESTPFDPAMHPLDSFGSKDVNLGISKTEPAKPSPAPDANNGTPSLQLPMNGNTPPTAPAPGPSLSPPPSTPPPLA